MTGLVDGAEAAGIGERAPHPHEALTATGLGMFQRSVQLGAGFGLAVIGTIASAQHGADATGAVQRDGYRTAFLASAAAASAGLIATLLWVRSRPPDVRPKLVNDAPA